MKLQGLQCVSVLGSWLGDWKVHRWAWESGDGCGWEILQGREGAAGSEMMQQQQQKAAGSVQWVIVNFISYTCVALSRLLPSHLSLLHTLFKVVLLSSLPVSGVPVSRLSSTVRCLHSSASCQSPPPAAFHQPLFSQRSSGAFSSPQQSNGPFRSPASPPLFSADLQLWRVQFVSNDPVVWCAVLTMSKRPCVHTSCSQSAAIVSSWLHNTTSPISLRNLSSVRFNSLKAMNCTNGQSASSS